MNLARLLLVVTALMFASCAATRTVNLTTYNLGRSNGNWDEIMIVKVDGRGIKPAGRMVHLTPGTRTVTFSLSYMRGDMAKAILAEVPVTGNFREGQNYRAFVHYVTGFMGVTIQERHDSPKGDILSCGTLIYSPDFDAYGQKKNANKTDAGNGSNGISRVIDASRSPSPDPGRSAKKPSSTL